ncbi:tripartite tricarboxylate transporter TctB family protein [Methylocella sp. CPCC 101449]|uniref:tripartite tricarboxylate transporter TctB family protein n=1 Tax=Methylocella sp. CPCC 101449 TaxID=2987531 RepID=UPI0028905A2B|nr:tripartite tricarboxylate transporter TctB family protein [Methylocella sp. CPCC 101449]MDT2023107.1 tripartite tricarboxylate transporter TctB family protein [Methylocella sp. CPCC 101449]
MVVKDIRDLLGGGVLIAIGVMAGLAAKSYGIGSPTAAEPGFFPVILSSLLTLIGLGVAVSGLDFSGKAPKGEPLRFDAWHLWCLVVIAGGFALFGLLLPLVGLFVSCAVTITLVGFGSRLLSLQGALATAFILSITAVVLFRYLLDLQVPAWPWGG